MRRQARERRAPTTQVVHDPWSLGWPMAEKPPISCADRASKDWGDVAMTSRSLAWGEVLAAAHRVPLAPLQTLLRSGAVVNAFRQAFASA